MQIAPCCRKTGGMAGLGFWEILASAVGGALANQGGSGGASSGAVPTSSNTSISPSIAVSPQISPNFVQQFQPSNSGVTTGAAQIASGSASSAQPGGYAPGYNSGYGSGYPATALPMSVDAAIPTVSTSSQVASILTQALPWLLGGAVLLLGIKAYKKR